MPWFRGILLGFALVAAGTNPAGAQAVEESHTIDVAGGRRSYLFYYPGTAAPRTAGSSGPVPLVLVFHGSGGSARGIARHTAFTELAEREEFAVAYPEGVGKRWNDGRGIHTANDDVAFVRTLLDTLRRARKIDDRRIYATGISNGAVFVHRLACELPGVFAAIASVAGAFPAKVEPRCPAPAPTALAAFHGTLDRLMPYHGSPSAEHPGAILSAERGAALWAGHNGCAATPTDSLLPERHLSDGTRVRRLSYRGCREDAPVVLYRIQGGGHTWPGGPAVGATMGRVSRELDATPTIWSFFRSTAAAAATTASPPATPPSSPTPSTTRRSSSPSRTPADR